MHLVIASRLEAWRLAIERVEQHIYFQGSILPRQTSYLDIEQSQPVRGVWDGAAWSSSWRGNNRQIADVQT